MKSNKTDCSITEKTIYLLNAKAYTQKKTVTKGTVKSHLPTKWRKKADKIYGDLKEQKLVEPTTKDGKLTKREGRFSITQKGLHFLIANLVVTDYKFTSSKGYKILNTLLNCIKETAEIHSQIKQSEEITFEEFEEKFKILYYEEKRQQAIQGVVAIHSKELCQKFSNQNFISQRTIEEYFERLKTTGKILAVMEKGIELIQWAG